MGRQLTDQRFRAAEFVRTDYRATLERGTTLDDLSDPDFWRLLSAQVRPGDVIEAAWEDGSGFLILYVRATPGGKRLVVEPIAGRMFDDATDAGDAPVDEIQGVRVEYAGQHEQWRVVLPGGIVLKSGLGEEREAKRQRTNYLKGLGRAAA